MTGVSGVAAVEFVPVAEWGVVVGLLGAGQTTRAASDGDGDEVRAFVDSCGSVLVEPEWSLTAGWVQPDGDAGESQLLGREEAVVLIEVEDDLVSAELLVREGALRVFADSVDVLSPDDRPRADGYADTEPFELTWGELGTVLDDPLFGVETVEVPDAFVSALGPASRLITFTGVRYLSDDLVEVDGFMVLDGGSAGTWLLENPDLEVAEDPEPQARFAVRPLPYLELVRMLGVLSGSEER